MFQSARETDDPTRASSDCVRDDPLLACLRYLAKRGGQAFSRASVLHGLPMRGETLPIDLVERAARRLGMQTRVVERRLDRIPRLVLPAIVLLQDGDACVLLERSGGSAAVVVYPGVSDTPRTVTLADLGKDASGHVVLVTGADADSGTGQRASAAPRRGHWFWSSVWPLWPGWLQIVIAALAINMLALAFPLFVMNVYDRVIPNLSISTLWVLAVGVAIALAFDYVLKQLRSLVLDTTGRRVDMKVAASLYEHALAVRMAARREPSGALAAKIRDFEMVRDFFTSASIIAITDLAFVGIFVAVLWLIVGPIAMIPLVAVPVVIGMTLLLQLPLARAVRRSQVHGARRHELLVDGLGGIETIKAVNGEAHMQRRWEEAVAATARANSSTKTWSSLAVYLTGAIQQLVGIVVVVWGVFLVADGMITVGGLIAASILSGRALAPLGSIVMTLARAQQARTALRDLDAFMALPRDDRGDAASGARVTRGKIAFRNVGFSYPGASVPALDDVSFTIEPGERVGIVGKTGSGKSTIGRLLAGLYETGSGSILVDDADIRRYDAAELRDGVGFVAQEAELFSGTIRQNIVLGRPDAPEEEIARAAVVSGVESFAAQHPLGLNIPVGERGRNLSGGQRQAVALARMLVRRPRVLFLDEPSSAMDTATEAALIRSLATATQGQTIVVCSHRVSFLTLVDRLIVIDAGRVVADGPRDEVLRSLQGAKSAVSRDDVAGKSLREAS